MEVKKMDLADLIKQAAAQQSSNGNNSTASTSSAQVIDLGPGRISHYEYNGNYRPTNEDCENSTHNRKLFNE